MTNEGLRSALISAIISLVFFIILSYVVGFWPTVCLWIICFGIFLLAMMSHDDEESNGNGGITK